MSEKISRPLAVWITQVVLLIFGCIWGFIALSTIYLALAFLSNMGLFMVYAFAGVMALFFSVATLISFWGLMKRKNYGRIIAAIILSFMLLSGVAGMFTRPQGPVQYYESKNSAERAGEFLGGIFINCVVALLLYGLVLGKRSKEFFSREKPGQIDLPPPPPTFEN